MQPAPDNGSTVPSRKRRRVGRFVFALLGFAWLLEWWMIEGINLWTGPYYGAMVYLRGDLMWETVYRTDAQSVECSVWRLYDEVMQAAPLVLISTGRRNRVQIGDEDNW